MNQHVEISIGTPLIDHYGNRGFIAEIKAPETKSFVIGAGMAQVRNEFVCVFDRLTAPISELADGIAAPFIERARRANLPTVPAAEIPARMQAARLAQRDAFDKAAADRDSAKQARQAFEADAAGKIPAWAKAVIVAELIKDESDSMTDYFGGKTVRTVILGFSSHSRDLFPEMRKAAANLPETAHLVDAPESAENRQKWSMGAGYFLKVGGRYSSGWQVRKQRFWDSSEPVRQLPTADWALAAPVPPAAVQTVAAAGMTIEEHTHTKKGFQMFICIMPERVDRETFDALRDKAEELGGWYSKPWGRTPGGFAFKVRDKAESFAGSTVQPVAESAVDEIKQAAPRADMADKLRRLADDMQGEIDGKMRDRLTNTPKRQREADSARLDGYRLQRTQAALRALAGQHEAGTIAPELARVTSKKAAFELVGTVIDRSRAGYYDAGIDTGKPSLDTPAARAIWALLDKPSDESRKAEELRRKVQALQFANIPGFFPTPGAVIERMIYLADMPAGAFDMLEPEGGSAAILDMVRERFPAARLTTYERHNSLREILALKGYTVAGADFMEAERGPRFDRVLMNPPFENGQDIEHVRHAHSMLRPGGKLIAVMSPGPFFRQDNKAASFRDWFDRMSGEKLDLQAGSFKESGTATATVLVTLDAGV
ncbi:methyltransferase [Mesorhizobium sp. B2-8-9]|uniref:methyltransferase n=1 Tax=Mesorhizobium sp. B2-8-9 TaxID=2589899 RepID=UPI00112D3A92|nr:methyltransferase [Mesorhizobium sp. B2-8-9]TPI86408.1 methyltransferase [Mesorhizobium sp. B2-8-9]